MGADISSLRAQLPAMVALAQERTESARVSLAGMLAEFLADQNLNLTLREQELVNELIDQLLTSKTSAVRLHLLEKFRDVRSMPRKMAISLANDNIDVAGRVLKECQTLIDEDLINIINNQTSSHAEAIAQRVEVSLAVTDALITTGNIRVMQLVAENLGAMLSPKAVEILTETARFCEELHSPLINRPELSSDNAGTLYWWVGKELRRQIMRRHGISASKIDEALSTTIDLLLAYHKLDRQNENTMAQVADWLSEREVLSGRILPQVLRLGHFCLFNILLGRLAAIDPELVKLIVESSGGRGLAVLCRAIGVDKAGFVSIFLLARGARSDDQIVHPRELSYALTTYDRLTIGMAKELLASWQRDPSYLDRGSDLDIVE